MKSVVEASITGVGVDFENKVDVGNVLGLGDDLDFARCASECACEGQAWAPAGVRRQSARRCGEDFWASLSAGEILSAQFYHDVQPLLIDVSQKFHSELDASGARDLLWRGLAVRKRRRSSE